MTDPLSDRDAGRKPGPPDRLEPLRDLRVVEVAHSLAGPFAGQLLADLGADVIKVERPGLGDPARDWGPPFCRGDGAIFAAANRNKRSLELDLGNREGRDVFRRLLEDTDVLIEALRPGALDRIGFPYETVRKINPRVLYCSVLAYGEKGPLRGLPGYDPLMQAHGGIMSVTGPPGGPPARVGTSIVDMGTGLWLVLGILAALRERDRTGRGRRISGSLFDTALSWSAYHLLGYLSDGHVPEPLGTELTMIAPYGAFPTSDGRIMIAAGNDALFRRACDVLEAKDLPGEERFADNPARVRHREELNRRFSVLTRKLSSEELLERFREAKVPAAPIRRIDEVAADAQAAASEMVLEMADGEGASYPTVAPPLRVDGERMRPRTRPPRMGEHTARLLRELEERA